MQNRDWRLAALIATMIESLVCTFPFDDPQRVIDPSTADVTARVVRMPRKIWMAGGASRDRAR